MPDARRSLTVVALLLIVFMAAVEGTVVATALPSVVGDLGGVTLYGWVGSAYLLAATVTMPLNGRLADLAGRRPVLLAGVGLFLVGSIASGAAPGIEVLIAARALQGLGAGAMQPVSITLIGDLYRIEERGRIQGMLGAVWGISGMAGPLFGALLVHTLGWRWVFWINVPIGLASAGLLAAVFREARPKLAAGRLDVPGAVLLMAAAVALLLGAGGTASALTLPLAAALTIAFVWVEQRAASPVLPLRMLAERHIAVAAVVGFFIGATMLGFLSYTPLFAQGVLGRSPSDAGSIIAPMLLAWPIMSSTSVRFLPRVGFRGPVWVGAVLVAAGAGYLALRGAAALTSAELYGVSTVLGAGMGLSVTATLLAVQSSVGWSERGVATAVNMFARSLGSALGVGALGALLARGLGERLDPARVRDLLDAEHRAAGFVADAAAIDALRAAFTPIFWAVGAFALTALVASLFFPRVVVRDDSPPRAAPESSVPAGEL
jgi:MFS family permease